MTTFDPDTLDQDLSVLRRINAEFAGRIALDCAVVQGGKLALGDPVELLQPFTYSRRGACLPPSVVQVSPPSGGS